MKHLVLNAALLMLLAACSPQDATQPTAQAPLNPLACGKDTDCKGERICEAGICTAPTATAAPAEDPALQAALLQALRPKTNAAHERMAESGPVIQAYARAGFVPLKPDARMDYNDYRLFRKPADFLGHTLVAIDEEYMTEYIGCCVSHGLAVTVKLSPTGQDLDAFAAQNACRLDRDEHHALFDPAIGLPKAPAGTYATLSCKERDDTR